MSEFLVQPPSADATVQEWEAWLKKEQRVESARKAAHTRTQAHTDIPEQYQATGMRKVGGCWTQALSLGFSGSADDDTLQGEVVVEANQDYDLALADMESKRNKRGKGRKKGDSQRRRKAQKRKK